MSDQLNDAIDAVKKYLEELNKAEKPEEKK